jgi:hypothetical protein
MFENLNQEQFEHILDILILYKQVNPNKNVYLNEKCVKDAIHFMNTTGQRFASQLGMNKNDDNE